MENQPPAAASGFEGSGWLVSPSVPSGIHLQLTAAAESTELSPEIFEMLGKAMTELQQYGARVGPKEPCGKLENCNAFKGPCSKLVICGDYSIKESTPTP
jgi:hypothetical protein